MAFKELSEKKLLALSEAEQVKYWQDFKEYYSEKKKKLEKQQKEIKKQETAKNKKRIDHATFVLFGELIKIPKIIKCIEELTQTANIGFSEKEKADINLLLEARKIKNELDEDIRF